MKNTMKIMDFQAFIFHKERKMNKKAFMRLVEAIFAILLITAAVIYLVNSSTDQNDISEDVYNQQDAQGFIQLFGLPLKVEALLDIEEGKEVRWRKPDYSIFKRD